jgi:valyl-tRNA synthetase
MKALANSIQLLEQLKKLGASCDWDRTHFTMDKEYSESVYDTFIDLNTKVTIYYLTLWTVINV